MTGDQRHPGFHDEYQVTHMHNTDSTLGSGLLSLCCEFSFNIQTRLSSVCGSMTKLVPLVRRCHIARESRFVGAGIRISEHSYIDAADRCCLRRLMWSNMSDLYRRYSPVISPAVAGRHVCTPPLLSRALHACVRVGAPAVSSYASAAKRKRN